MQAKNDSKYRKRPSNIRVFIGVLLAIYLFHFHYFPATAAEKSQPEDYITYGDLIKQLRQFAKNDMAPSQIIKKEFSDLQHSHDISDDEDTYWEFILVRLAFELTRDSGLWQIRWAVTNKQPNSDEIWRQWVSLVPGENFILEEFTATAECDELTALFAFVAKSLGVKNVGLFWPTWNHTVGVWTAKGKHRKAVRVVVPTSQIFISENASLGTKEFDPLTQKTIYNYGREDIVSGYRIPLTFARLMLQQARTHAARPAAELQRRRNRLSRKFGGS